MKYLIISFIFSFTALSLSAQDDFITTWRTNASNPDVTIPINPDPSLNYIYDIDWGDGTSNSDVTGSITHTYTNPGIHQISISGLFPAIYINNEGDKDILMSIDQWGDISWATMDNAFFGASGMQYNALDEPDLRAVTDLSGMFRDATRFNGELENWDVRNVTNMKDLFNGATRFNQDLGDWVVSSVGDMEGMFNGAEVFNQDISEWKVHNVTDMSSMFRNATSFNQDIRDWDVGSVTNMRSMFSFASSFNQVIGDWDVSNVTRMDNMFTAAASFNQDIGDWDVGNVTGMFAMFNVATSFNQDIGDWDVGNVAIMAAMFAGASSFNQNIGDWDVGNVTSMTAMFNFATSFNQDIGDWDVSNVTNMSGMFVQAFSFNQDIGDWDVTGDRDMSLMLNNSGISQLNFDMILNKWSEQLLFPGIELGALGLRYCNGLDGFNDLVDNHIWTIVGATFDCVNAQPCLSTIVNTWTGPLSGTWNEASNWSLGTIPNVCDEVVIPNGHIISLTDNAECFSLDISVGSEVEFADHVLIVWTL